MNLQDFVCVCSKLIWDEELGWDRPGGLRRLYEEIEKHVKYVKRDIERTEEEENIKTPIRRLYEEIEKYVKRDQKRNKKEENTETSTEINQKKSEYKIICDYTENCENKLNELSEDYYIDVISMCSMDRIYLSILVSITPKK